MGIFFPGLGRSRVHLICKENFFFYQKVKKNIVCSLINVKGSMVFYKVVERDNPSTLKDFMGENSSHPHVMEKRKINIILEACIDCILTETKLEGA